jgi:hypothetical protein
MIDEKAKKILFETYWKKGYGYLPEDKRHTSKEDFKYAKSKGLMFDPFTIGHDDCISEIKKLSRIIPEEKVVRAFLCSLSARRLEWRSAIASFFISKKIFLHKFKRVKDGTMYLWQILLQECTCRICRDTMYGIIGDKKYRKEDLNILNFQRIKWGGVRYIDIIYPFFDLREFRKERIPEVKKEDIAIFKDILKVIKTSAPNDYPSVLEKRLKEVIKSNKSERKILMEILGCIGILKPKTYKRPLRGKFDWTFVLYWRGEDKYNLETVKHYFGKYL